MSDSGDQRIKCRYCGANNFAGTVSCWACSRPILDKGATSAATRVESAAQERSFQGFVPASGTPVSNAIDPNLANKAAAALGMLFPVFGIPVGIIFLMLDDRRKAQLGWISIWWSIGGTVLSIVLTLLFLGPMLAMSKQLIPSIPLHGGLPDLGGDANILLPSFDWDVVNR